MAKKEYNRSSSKFSKKSIEKKIQKGIGSVQEGQNDKENEK